jgi:cell division protein ZapE
MTQPDLDPGQRAVLTALDQLRAPLERPPRRRPLPARGLYLWGDVGRGKTMLMDLFFTQTAIPDKRRFHFDAFMRDLHAHSFAARSEGHPNPLAVAADRITSGARLLALDEMQVRDSADSTLLRVAFDHLLAQGLLLVTTSNVAPAGLFVPRPNRAAYQPLIDLLTQSLTEHHLTGPVDYRQQATAAPGRYVWPNDALAKTALDRLWQGLGGDAARPKVFDILGRAFVITRFHDGMARMTFDEACATPRSPADYLELCAGLRLLVLDDVPRMSAAKRDAARRFITLVDALYDARVRLIVSAEVGMDHLYPDQDSALGALASKRVISRLTEMQGWA